MIDDALLELVRDRAAASEETRCLDDEVVAAIAATGVNRLLLPAELGGAEAHPRELLAAVAAVAAADGSTGWCTVIAAASNVFAGYVPEDRARETFADPDAGGAGVFAAVGSVTPEGDGHVLSGRWPFASNCRHARWIALGAWVKDADGGNAEPFPRLVLVPSEDLEVEDTWHTGGLRGTGSHHVRAENVRVDLDRSCGFVTPAWPAGTLWRVPVFTVLATTFVGAPLGMARGAVDELVRLVRDGNVAARGSLVDDPVALADLAAADAALRAAYAGVVAVMDEAWAAASAGERASRQVQARAILAVQHALDTAVAATSTAHRLAGGAAAFSGHRVLRALRDVETARQHVMFSHQHRPALMRIAAGHDETAPPFVT